MAKSDLEFLIFAPKSEPKSAFDTLMRLQGIDIVSGPVHTDGPNEFAEAERAAHDIEACLSNLHDTVLDATGQSMSDDELRNLLARLPNDIKEQVNKWGLADTEVNEQIYSYLRQQAG